MNLLEKIKFNYNVKIFAEDLKNLNFDSLRVNLHKISKNPYLYYNIYRNFYQRFDEIANSHNLFPNNLIFINSFFSQDLGIIKDFINYYFKKINHQNFIEIKYEDVMNQINILVNEARSSMPFEDIVANSIIYQSLFSFMNREKILFVENIHTFFSTTNNYNFTNPYLTKCYFLVVDEPIQIYQDTKLRNKSDKDIAQNIMFNLDSAPLFDKTSNITISRKSWPIHTLSWTDPNVINSLKGLVLKKELLLNKDLDTYASIIHHLNQYNLKINLQYDLIKQYLEDVNFDNQIYKTKISNNERKFIEKNIQGLHLNLSD